MSKTITIKLTKTGANAGPFTITDAYGNIIASGVTLAEVSIGISYIVDDDVNIVTITSEGRCHYQKSFAVGTITQDEYQNTPVEIIQTGCIWRHMLNNTIYNTFYGKTEPYIIEYPFAYQYQDEILQFVKDYSRVYKYTLDPYGVSNNVSKVELNDVWFNKAVLYNGQQSTGVLELVPKPLNSLKSYMNYPIFNKESKTIIYTKTDNFYNYNTFWSIVKDKNQPLFTRTCESLSLDKVVNQINMDYGSRSFKKEPLRAKELRIRHILDNRSDVSLISQFIIAPAQISYL
jgi:hypothetical protein